MKKLYLVETEVNSEHNNIFTSLAQSFPKKDDGSDVLVTIEDGEPSVFCAEEDGIALGAEIVQKGLKAVKVAKPKKKVKVEKGTEDKGFKNEIYSHSVKFGEVSLAMVTTANARHEDSREQANRKYQLKIGHGGTGCCLSSFRQY